MKTRCERLSIAVLVVCGLSGCAATLKPAAFQGGVPEMRPELFFAGPTSSSGVQENRSGGPTRRYHVNGVGQALPNGEFRLDQTITFEQDAPTTRAFIFRRLDAHHYVATLTDASGPVHGEVYGNLLHLRYPMKHPFHGRMEQWLYLQPDNRTVLNEATIRVFGIVVARLSERITQEKP
ncbi:MAG: DUF3833 domain-containing protein [Gemmatimonadota bacterium]|nr:DUF3833 domain-containing protein [Gemmatimonadota bacterium]